MLRLVFGTLFVAAAVVSIAASLDGDPCDDDDGTVWLYAATGPLIAAAVFAALYRRMRVGWLLLCSLSVGVVTGGGAVVFALVRWAENCAR